MPLETTNDRVAAVEKIVNLFKLERYLYLLATGVSTVVVMVVGAINLFKGGDPHDAKILSTVVAPYGGPAGLMLFSCGQFLKMFSRAMDSIDGVKAKTDDSVVRSVITP